MKPFSFEYKKLFPFRWYVLENFPFIEATFDGITEYQLYCKLCEYVNKTIEKLNELGLQTENITNAFEELQNYVNNYFETLDIQDEINNKLDEMVEDGTLARIINEQIFAELNQKISNDVEYHFIKTGDLSGDCVLIKTKTKAFLFDLSNSTNYQNITNYLNLQNISHIDGIIISHFHYDHVGGNQAQGFVGLINSSYVGESTQVYIPTNPDFTQFTNDPETSASDVVARVTEIETYVLNACNSGNINVNYMTTGDILNIDNLILKFLNCSENEYENYYDVLQTFDGGLHYCTNYNNFSMVIECKNLNNTTLLTGDIEEKAEEILAPFINRNINLKKVEHHGVNRDSNSDYLIKSNSDLNVIMNTTNDTNMTTMRACYGYIFMTGKKLYSTIENSSMKFLDNGNNIWSENQLIEKNLNIVSIISGLTGIKAGGLKNLNLSSYKNEILENTDLNDIIVPGDYCCFSTATSATIINKPNFSGAFKLTVEQISNVERYQQKIVFNTTQYVAFIRTYTGSWSVWERIKTDEKCIATIDSNITINDNNYHTIPFSDASIITNGLELLNNGKIKCKKAGDYVINVNTCFGGSSLQDGDRLIIAIQKNDTRVFLQQQDAKGTQQSLIISGFIVHLSEDDEISILYRNFTEGRGVLIAEQTFLSIIN